MQRMFTDRNELITIAVLQAKSNQPDHRNNTEPAELNVVAAIAGVERTVCA